MNLPIVPYVGAGPLKLGATPQEMRQIIGGEYHSFMKSVTSELPTDDFIGKGLHVHYKPPGVCEAIEMFPPSSPTFRGYRLLDLPFAPLASYFKQEDPSVEIEDDGLISRFYGLGLYAPDLDGNPNALVEAVIVFERGYYEQPQADPAPHYS